MQMYKLITGNTQDIGTFEQNISALLEDGYALEGPLVALAGASGANTQLFQAMLVEEDFSEEEEESDEDDEDE